MHKAKSLKEKITSYFHTTKKNFKKKFSMHFGFNNQFIKVTRTWPIFQKFQKNYFCFLLISRIMNLYVKRIPDIEKLVLLLM